MSEDPDIASRLRDTVEPPPLPEPASAVLPAPVQPYAPPPQYLAYSSSMYLPYDSARPRARVLVRLLWIVAALQVVMVWPGMDDIFELREARALQEDPLGAQVTIEDMLSPANLVFLGVLIVQGILWIVMIVFWMMWVHRTYRNLRPLGAEGLSTTPAWAVAYNFIPIVHMFRPFTVMLETWRASDPRHRGGTDWQTLPASRLVLAWWAVYVVSFVVAVSSALVMMFSGDLDTRYAAAWAGLFGVLSELVVLVMQVRIVQRLTGLQEARASSFGSVPFASQARAAFAP